MKKRYLIPGDYMADPSVHVFENTRDSRDCR